MANSRDIDRAVSAMAARSVTGSIYDVRPVKKAKPRQRAASNRPGDQAAEYAAENGVSYERALVACNMD